VVAAAGVPENYWQDRTVQLKHCAVAQDKNKYIRGRICARFRACA